MKLEDIIKKIENDLINNKLYFKHSDLLIVGENTSGKSKIIKEVVKGLMENKVSVYVIDSCNRNIIITEEDEQNIFDTFENLDLEMVVTERLKDKNFNNIDIFDGKLEIEIALNEIIKNFELYKELFNDIINITLEKRKKEAGRDLDYFLSKNEEKIPEEIYVNGEHLNVASDSQHAMMRILMEVNFAYQRGCRIIFIDEFDINLDHKNSADFINKLKDKYNDARFIIAAHSIYTVLNIDSFDVLKIIKKYDNVDENMCINFDSRDLDNVEIIDRKIFGSSDKQNDIDILLSETLKSILSGVEIDSDVKQKIEALTNLSIRQKVVYEYIKERL